MQSGCSLERGAYVGLRATLLRGAARFTPLTSPGSKPAAVNQLGSY